MQLLGAELLSWAEANTRSMLDVLASGRSCTADGVDVDDMRWHLARTLPGVLRVQRAMALHPLLCATPQQAAHGDAACGSGGSSSSGGSSGGAQSATGAGSAVPPSAAPGVYDTDISVPRFQRTLRGHQHHVG